MTRFAIFLFLVFLLGDLLSSVVYSVFCTLLDLNIVIPGSEEKGTDRPCYAVILDDAGSIEKLALASRFFCCACSASGLFLILRYLPKLEGYQVFLWVLGLALLIPFLEVLPRAVASGSLCKSAEKMAGMARFFSLLFTPFYSLCSRLLPEVVTEVSKDAEVEEIHLRDWVESIPENTLLEQGERQMIRSIVHFSNTLVREIMIPRVELDALEVDEGMEGAVRKVLDSGHSRLPVYEDEIDNIIGVLYAKDLLRKIHAHEECSLCDLVREPLYTPESKKAGDLLNEMQRAGVHMAVVVDEYGGTSGIVSMEDIVEEIVGEIRDEYDEKEETLVQELDEDSYSFLGRIDLEDVNETLETHLTREAADTLAGFLYSRLGKVPAVGEQVKEDDWLFEITELNGKQIRRVLAKRALLDEDVPAEEAEENAPENVEYIENEEENINEHYN